MTDLLLWADAEMTGLDPKTDLILEVSLMPTTRTGVILDDPVTFLINSKQRWFQDAIDRMPEVVQEMHTKSGLFDDLRDDRLPKYRYSEARAAILELIAGWGNALEEYPGQKFRLAGASVQFDKSFLDLHFFNNAMAVGTTSEEAQKDVQKRMSHRILDVSTLKYFFPQAIKEDPGYPKFEGPVHRAKDDMLNSYEEYVFFLKQMYPDVA